MGYRESTIKGAGSPEAGKSSFCNHRGKNWIRQEALVVAKSRGEF